MVDDGRPIPELCSYLAGCNEKLYELCEEEVPTTQISQKSLATHPPFLPQLIVILEKFIETNMHNQQRCDRISLQVSLDFVISMVEHELEIVKLFRGKRPRFHLFGSLL